MNNFKIARLQSKLNTYKESLDYLTKWCKANQELSLKISEFLAKNSDKFNINQMKTVTQYHIEISKVMYATVALLDKIYRNEERLEKWKEDLQNVQ